MQEEMIREIERARSKYLVFVVMNNSWLYRPQSIPRLLHGQMNTRRQLTTLLVL